MKNLTQKHWNGRVGWLDLSGWEPYEITLFVKVDGAYLTKGGLIT